MERDYQSGGRDYSRGYDQARHKDRGEPTQPKTKEEQAADRVARFRSDAEHASTRAAKLGHITVHDEWRTEKATIEKTRERLQQGLAECEKDAEVSDQARSDLAAGRAALAETADALRHAKEPRSKPPLSGELEIEPLITDKSAGADDVLAWAARLSGGERNALRERLVQATASAAKDSDPFGVALANYLASGRLMSQFRNVLANPKKYFDARAYDHARAARASSASGADSNAQPFAPTHAASAPKVGARPADHEQGSLQVDPQAFAPPTSEPPDSILRRMIDTAEPDLGALDAIGESARRELLHRLQHYRPGNGDELAARFVRLDGVVQTQILTALRTTPNAPKSPDHAHAAPPSPEAHGVLSLDVAESGNAKNRKRIDEAATVADKTTSLAPAPAPKLDERDYHGPLTAAAYFAWNQVKILEAMRNRFASVSLPPPHQRLLWTDATALATAFEHALLATSGTGMDLAHRLPELLYPTDAFAIIDQHRDLEEGRPGTDVDGKPARGSRDWNPIVGKALAIEFEASLRHSLPRMGLRYVAQADDYHGSVAPDLLVASSPLDLVVARLLCDPHFARFVPQSNKNKRKHEVRDTDAPTAFKNGLRLVSVEWMGAHDPKLWNYVRVTDCPDATAEEVSAALYERGDEKNHTEYAYGLIVSSPFVRVPPQWARNMPGAKEYAPAKDDDSAEASSALDLADSAVADEAARAQAGKPAAKLDMNALSRTLANSEAQLRFIGDQLGDWKLAHLVGPALRRVSKQREALLATPTETLKAWSAVANAQTMILVEATGDIVEVLQVAAGAHIQPTTPEAAPFKEVVEAFGIAMGESHLSQTATAQLAVARQKKSMLPFVLQERALRENHEVTQQMGADKPAPINTAAPQDPAANAQATNRSLEANLLDMRGRALAGDMPATADLEDASIATSEETLSNRLIMLHDRVGKYEAAVSGSDEGFAKVVNVALKPLPDPKEVAKRGGQFTADDYQALAAKLRAVQMKAYEIGAQMRRASIPDKLPDDPAQARAAIAAARKKAVADAQAAFAKLADADLEKMLQRAVKLIEDARINQMIVDIALMIGISVAAGLAGSWIGGLVRGAMLADAAVDTAAFAGSVTRAQWMGGAANVLTDAGVQAVGQTAVFGGNTGLSFGENVMTSILTLGALRPIHTLAGELGGLDEQAKGMWKVLSKGRVAFVHAGTFTAEMLVGAGASYVAARMVHGKPKNEEEATAWGLQGAAMAVGHYINRRLGPIQERLGQLGEHGVHLRKRADAQSKLAVKLEHSGSTEQALHLLEEHTKLLKDEHALLNDPAFIKRSGLDEKQVETLRVGNSEALADTKSQARDMMELRFLGLEPVASNGLVWSGDRTQIELVLADASSGVRNVAPAGERAWTAEMGGQRVTFVERDRGPEQSGHAPSAAQAEINRAMARRAISINAQRSQQVTALIAGEEAPKVKHITVGEGVAASLSHSTQTQGAGAMPGAVNAMPEAIAISDGPDWWQILGDRDIGQPVGDWRSDGYRRQPGDFNHDHKSLGRASDVAYANAITALESGMVSVRGRITQVEQHSGSEEWPVPAKWRVKVDDHKWVYCDSVAFAGGLGIPKKVGAVSDALEQVLQKGGRITYAQQQLIPSLPEGATIVVVGDSGTAGWAAQEAVRTGRKAVVIARNGSLSNMPPHLRQYVMEHGISVVSGELQTATLENGRLSLGVSKLGSDVVQRTIVADGLSVAIGQTAAAPAGMESLRFRMMKRVENGKERVVALEAYDPGTGQPTGLVVQGAAMTTRLFKEGPLLVDDREEFVKALARQANDPDVPTYSKNVEPSIHQSARNIPLSNERPL